MVRRLELPEVTPASTFARFRAFWHQLDAVRASVVSSAAVDRPGETAIVPTEEIVRTRLLGILRAQEAEVSRAAHGAVPQAYREAHYLMTALADDVFLRLPWSGASSWIWRPLELEIYGTRCAGRLVFERIARVTAAADPASRELAAVYLIALALGFEGEFADRTDRTALREHRRRLRELVSGGLDTFEGPLVPDCYAQTLIAGRGSLLQNVGAWGWAAAIVIGVWLIASTVAWRQATAPVVATARAEAAVAQGTR